MNHRRGVARNMHRVGTERVLNAAQGVDQQVKGTGGPVGEIDVRQRPQRRGEVGLRNPQPNRNYRYAGPEGEGPLIVHIGRLDRNRRQDHDYCQRLPDGDVDFGAPVVARAQRLIPPGAQLALSDLCLEETREFRVLTAIGDKDVPHTPPR